jgi:hypothetical protein
MKGFVTLFGVERPRGCRNKVVEIQCCWRSRAHGLGRTGNRENGGILRIRAPDARTTNRLLELLLCHERIHSLLHTISSSIVAPSLHRMDSTTVSSNRSLLHTTTADHVVVETEQTPRRNILSDATT